jgi:DNA-binding NtrC family response regulator/CheY-like chemotaxis protein
MKSLKILVVEDEPGPIEQVKEIVRLFAANKSADVDVQVMKMVPLKGEVISQRVVEKSWDYDLIVLDLEVPISGASISSEIRSKYEIAGRVYGGCLAANLMAQSGFRGFVLVNSAWITEWPESLREGRAELGRGNRLFYFKKDGEISKLDFMLRQVLHTAVANLEFTSDLHQRIRFAAATDYPVLLLGETGTGKEKVAHSIHQNWSLRKATEPNGADASKERPFLTINCALLHGELLRDELMGHVKGAFTGASQHKLGAILRAAGLSPALQPKDDAEGGPDFGQLNVAHNAMVRASTLFKKAHEQPIGNLLQVVTAFCDELREASEQTKRFLERTVQSAVVGSEAFKKWLRKLGGTHIEERTTDSSPLDLVYNNKQTYGTIFLDEIGYLDPPTQGMLLRFLGSYEVSPLGYEGTIKLGQLRIIAATSNPHWLEYAGVERTKEARETVPSEAPKSDLYHRLAYHVIILDSLHEHEVEVFVERNGKTRAFWDSRQGKHITAEIKKAVQNQEFLGHRRELEKLIVLIESYLDVLPFLGRDETPNQYDNVSWEFVKSNLWYAQQRVGVFATSESNDPATKAAEDLQRKIKETVETHLGFVEWGKDFSDRKLREILKSVVDGVKKRKLQDALLGCVKMGRAKNKDEIARIAVPGVKDYQALKDLVKPPSEKKHSGSST